MLVHSPASQPRPPPVPHLDTSTATLASPRDMSWDSHSSYSADAIDAATWNYYTLPPSPPASVSSNADDSPQPGTKTIKPRFASESHSERSCLPTSQVFDLDGPSSPSSASPPPAMACQLTLSPESGSPLKRSFATIGGIKKGRGGGERITTKDFVPPDVTGLSKREARLLKNRAAAFLSRQRKREEFEAMEIRVRELEEENVRLQALAERGKKYDDLVQNVEQLRMRLSMADKRERELATELAHRTAASLAVKGESHDLHLPPASYPSYPPTGPATVVTLMKQSLLSSLPSLLSVPPHTALPITLSVPLTGPGSARPPSSPFGHQSASGDVKDQGRPRFGHGSIEFHPTSADVESSKKMAIGGAPLDARQFDTDGHHCLGSLVISFDASTAEDGRGSVRIHVSERMAKAATQGNKQRSLSLASWSGADASFPMTCYASPPPSAPGANMDHLGGFTSAHSRLDFDTQLMSQGYTPFAQYEPEQTFDYYPGLHLE